MIRQLFSVVGPDQRPVLRRMLVALCAAAVLQGVAFTLLVPVLRELLGDHPDRAWPWLWALLGASAAYGIAHYAALLTGYQAGATLSRSLHHRIGDHVSGLPLGWFGPERVGRLSQLATQNVMDVMGVPAHLLRPLVTGFLTPATVVALMFVFDWRLALAAALTVPFIVLVYRWSANLARKADALRDEARAEAANRILEFVQFQPVLRVFGRGPAGRRALGEALENQRDLGREVLLAGVPGIVGFTLVVQAAFTTVTIVGTYLALGGELAVAELLALLVLAARFVEPLSEAATLGSSLRMARNALEKVEELLKVPALPEPAATASPRDSGIELDGVGFGYDGRPVLSDVSFTVPPRTMTALVGPSGSGKTTVTRLIARFWDVESGAVRIGGADVRDLTTEDLMSRISMVFQDVYLFEGTIEDNIRVGRPDATPAEVREAARLAHVDEIAARLPQGWDTKVGEGGSALSGGERQRVSIARALLKDSDIVLLDEATAALDPENEHAVQAALAALTADRTLLVIAHRMPTVMAADQIVVLDGGRIAERGTHEELVVRGGRYAAFWSERNRAGGWRLGGGASSSTPSASPTEVVKAAKAAKGVGA
ncbi:ABC transporter ATP-binding protein, partial [Streptomyces sp. URMC 126]|uniref:ABC transporter ATP-binding protein n=1 Tax=Streptomyces sp. URMC 126 TaxID=3423401 RepID=UPI003F1D64CA